MNIFVSSVQYNQQCTFSFGTCNWHIGRRWQIKNLDDEKDVNPAELNIAERALLDILANENLAEAG